jgi:hypothetical protein
MSETSLRDIMAAYFDGLEQFFGAPYAQMKEHDATPAEIATDLASRDSILHAFEAKADEFFGAMAEFWERNRAVVDRYVADLKALKAVYGGDLFPSYQTGNIASSTGLYMDTIVIPDPVLRIADFRPWLNSKDVLYFAAKHSLNALTYRELALADVEPPIVVITSDPLTGNAPRVEHLKSLAGQDVLLHMEKIFGKSFSSEHELEEFLDQFSDLEQIATVTRDSRRVLFDSEWPNDVVEQFRKHTELTGSRFTDESRSQIANRPPGLAIADILRGRFMQTNDIILSSQRLRGTPIVDAPTSWQYLLWKYEYDIVRAVGRIAPPDSHDLLIAKALQSGRGDSTLNVLRASPKILIELRRNGALAEFREILRNGIEDITLARASDLDAVTNAITENINAAMLEHQAQMETLARSGVKWYGLEVAPMIVSASISIVGAATGNVALTTAGVVAGALGTPTLKDALRHGKKILGEYKYLRQSAAGILFRNI